MFTGLIEELGKVIEVQQAKGGIKLSVSAKFAKELSIGESVAVNGCCLTVVNKTSSAFSFDVMEETIKKTNLKYLQPGEDVNLERALKSDARLGGHFVLGHVDAACTIKSIINLESSHVITFSLNDEELKYFVKAGSIAIDGISMTVAQIDDEEKTFSVGVIPHTWKETNLSFRKAGDAVNLEFDILGKYAARLLELKH